MEEGMLVIMRKISKIIMVGSVFMGLCCSGLFADEAIQVIPKESGKNTALRKILDKEIDSLSQRMLEINDWIYHHPEPGFLEFKAAAMLIEELKKHQFFVEEGLPGLDDNFDRLKIIGGFPADYAGPKGIPTAFKAKYQGRSGHPVIGIAVEYDALRGNPPFHGC
jgi:hypothetical protein